MDTEQFALLCKAFGDSHRIEIAKQLAEGEKCACNLLENLSITQSTLSHHMKILAESSLVIVRKEGKWSHYRLNRTVFDEFASYVNAISCGNSDREATCLQ